MRKYCLLGIVLLGLGVIWCLPLRANGNELSDSDIIIVCNKNVPAESLTKEEIKKIFLGRITEWDDQKKIKFVTLKTEKDHKRFLKQYIGKSEAQYRNYFNMMVFTGKGRAPKSFPNVKSLIEYVSNTDGAIGYISAGAKNVDTKNVKIIDSIQ